MKVHRPWLALGVCAMAAAMSSLGPAPALAAEAGPAWEVVQTTTPTDLIPGSEATASEVLPRWTVFLTNVGNAPSQGANVTDVLPEGITIPASLKAEIAMPNGAGRIVEPCLVAGRTVTCRITRSVSSGELVQIFLPIAVGSTTAPEVENQVSVSGGGAPPASSSVAATVSSTETPSFGFLPSAGLRAIALGAAGAPAATAGSHPFTLEVGAEFKSEFRNNSLVPSQNLRTIQFGLPAGVVANPSAVRARCTTAELASSAIGCPVASQVGVVFVEIAGLGRSPDPIYSMVPPPGYPAELAFSYDEVVAHVLGGLGSNFHLTAESRDLLTKFSIVGLDAFLWGVPSDPAHDPLRFGKGCTSHFGCSMGSTSPAPFLTMPSSCSEATELEGTAVSWLEGEYRRTVPLSDRDGQPIHLSSCGSLAFEPTLQAKTTTEAAERPTGLDVDIHQPQDESLEGRATSTLKDVTVTLPEGMTLNAAGANGLASCSEAQMGYEPELEPGKIRFSTQPQSCPDAAKVGTVEVVTPLLKGASEETLGGSVYVAKPFDNPFGSLLAIYLAIEGKKSGIIAKLAGKVESNPITGQLTATFTENPELPIEDIHVDFFGGENAALTTPLTCGSKTTSAILTPWSNPEGADANLSDSFRISAGCSSSESAAPKSFSFTAGTVSPLSGAYSPFVLRLSRPDGSQHITGLETTLPEGLIGKLAGVAYCPDSGIAQAISREKPEQGKLEQQNPSCPSSSEVGTVNVTAGSGSNPIPVSGHAYLAGPYKGAPLSLVAIVPAVAGPFDLGTVVDRVALDVGAYDARIHAVADPLPTIKDGIPLDVRSIELRLNRSQFTLNPTSCEEKAIEASVATQAGQTQQVTDRFQVGECERLAFKPKLQLSLKGVTAKGGNPALKAVVTYPKGEYTNIARAQVSLPHSEFLNNTAIAGACTKPKVEAHACPANSIYGTAKAWTPLLDKPLEGPVYLVGGYGYKLPALVAELDGQIRVLLVGKVDSGKNHGIRNTFEAVPDAPVSRFVLELKGGRKYGLLENSEDLCRKRQKAGVVFRAQNGRQRSLTVGISNSCGKRKRTTRKTSRPTQKSTDGKSSQTKSG